MNTDTLADRALANFYERMVQQQGHERCAHHPTSVRVVRLDDTEFSAPLAELRLTADGALIVESIYDGREIKVFERGTYRLGKQYRLGESEPFSTIEPPAEPVHEFDETDLALGRDY